jgi:xanthine dehydrogenase accessory factor
VAGQAKGIIETALTWMKSGRKVALATVISTWGSSPRGVGNQLVVDEEGNFEGSVSGGCVESTIITEAQYTIDQGKPQLLTLGVSNGSAWDAGLACGGSIEIFVEDATPYFHLWQLASKRRESNESVCLITQMDSGEKWLLDTLEVRSQKEGFRAELGAAVLEVLSCGISRRVEFQGKSYFLHGVFPDPQMIIVGAVHIAQPLATMGLVSGYHVKIVDPREAFATAQRFPNTELIPLWPVKAFERLKCHSQTALLALSHTPRLDDPALTAALDSDAFYIGALGSKKTHAQRLARLGQEGYSHEALARIHGPVGLSIGSVTPAEIALSIMAEITQVRRGGRSNRRKALRAPSSDPSRSISGLETNRVGAACEMVF